MKISEKTIVDFKQKIFGSHYDTKVALSTLKKEYEVSDIKKVLRHIDSHPVVKRYFYGNPFPKRLKDLGKSFYTYFTDFEKECKLSA